ncbi:MAG: Gfo/Idh/MocA family oxidoreductase [Streptococcaceae bacterium]|jgi:virulence factor|nr:Gfo/Idh/MocA family oxidoreductase [Streptococcaceae bacterium]
MKIGIIGATGGIASKAYLPVYAGLQAEHDFIVYSRDLSRAEAVRSKYRFAKATNILANLDGVDIVFIHAATSAHFNLAKHFLEKNISVMMDKPISENFAEVQELYRLASEQDPVFMIALNRRFVPMGQELKEVANKSFVKVTKNLSHHQGDFQFQMYDIFIHPLDTLIYLLDDEILDWNYQLVREGKNLQRIVVSVRTATTLGLASMNLNAGAYEEIFEVEADSGTYRLKELTELEEVHDGEHTTRFANAWASATYNRGFDEIINSAIAVVKGEKVELRQKNVLKSHEIIAQIIEQEGI